tara:strand:- start:62 stop:631 length:570 start_codon:yes stop_codon:yes gene_type:complete
MKLNYLWFFCLTSLFCGCGSEVVDETENINQILDTEPENIIEEEVDNRFVSSDRILKEIFSDYEKPLNSFPQIWQDEAVVQKNGRLYRENINDEPFTGTVVESFDDGSIALETSYYRGLPHGQQVRNFPNGQRALEVNFDQGSIVGTKSRWWPNGVLREEGYWSEQKYLGRRLWDQTGRLIKEEIVPQN